MIDEQFAENLCAQLGGPGLAPNFSRMLSAAQRLARKRSREVAQEEKVVATKMDIIADHRNK